MVLYDHDLEHFTAARICGGHLRSQFHLYVEPGVSEVRRPDIGPDVALLEVDIALRLFSVLPTGASNMLGVCAGGYDSSY